MRNLEFVPLGQEVNWGVMEKKPIFSSSRGGGVWCMTVVMLVFRSDRASDEGSGGNWCPGIGFWLVCLYSMERHCWNCQLVVVATEGGTTSRKDVSCWLYIRLVAYMTGGGSTC